MIKKNYIIVVPEFPLFEFYFKCPFPSYKGLN